MKLALWGGTPAEATKETDFFLKIVSKKKNKLGDRLC